MNARVAGVLLALTGFFVIVSATRIQTQTAAPDRIASSVASGDDIHASRYAPIRVSGDVDRLLAVQTGARGTEILPGQSRPPEEKGLRRGS